MVNLESTSQLLVVLLDDIFSLAPDGGGEPELVFATDRSPDALRGLVFDQRHAYFIEHSAIWRVRVP